MNSASDPERGTVCAANPFAGGFRFQSSQPHLKRFIMFDHSGGKGRVFFHPALAPELFGSTHTQDWESKGLLPDKGSKGLLPDKGSKTNEYSSLLAYKQMVEGAFTSLQSLRANRQSDMLCVQLPNVNPLLPAGVLPSSQKPRVSETMAKDGISWALDAQAAAQPRVASETLVCEEKPKVLAILPSTDSLQDCRARALPECSNRSQLSGTNTSDVAAAASGLMQENTEDLDALLSSDEEDDEDVRSTGHSPDESSGRDESCGEDEDDDLELHPNKRRRIVETCQEEVNSKDMSVHKEEANGKASFPCERGSMQSNRRMKIKKTVKALRKMIPGGALMDAALVLDETIMYVKTLRDRVNQLEATRFQSHHHHKSS
eukprot:c21642_g1_i1 orf=226-1347(-)